MYPEAGGSSSFARRAFNEFWSFFAAWGQMLNYIITIAISAFFVPHYLGVFWSPLGESPADIVGGIVVIVVLGALNIVGVKESAGLNVFLALADFCTQVALVVIGLVLVFSPDTLVNNIDLWSSPTLSRLPDRDPGRHGRLHRHRDDLQHGRGGARLRRRRSRARIGRRGGGRVRDLRVPAGRRAVGDAGRRTARRCWRCPRSRAATPTTRSSASSRTSTSAALQHAAEIYVGILAATILFIATNAGMIGVSRLTYSMGQYRQLPERLRALHPQVPHALRRDHRLRAGRLPDDPARPGRLPGHDLRVRGDAVVHDRARGGGRAADQAAGRRATLARSRQRCDGGATTCRCSRSSGELGTGIAFVVVTVLNLRMLVAGAIWLSIGITTYVVYRRRQGLSLTETHKVVTAQAGGRARGRVRVGAGRVRGRRTSRPEAVATAVRLAARRRRGIHVLVTITVPPNSPIDARCPSRRRSRRR